MTTHRSDAAADAKEPMLAHNVFFSLKNPSPAARDAMVAACKKYLTGHPGTVSFAVGTLAAELNRPVNDQAFDIALMVMFENRAAHDHYQQAPRHLAFIAENKENWLQVRVFDSLVQPQ